MPIPYKIRLAEKVLIQNVFGPYPNILSDLTFNSILFKIMFGRKPNFSNPSTFSEFVCARKLRDDAFDLWPYTDKYEVRKYVEERIGTEYLNQSYGIYDTFDEIDFEQLPDRFVLRGTHGSGYNVLVKDKNYFDKKSAKRLFDRWLKQNYYYRCRERNYFKIKPRIICDRFLESKEIDGLPEIKVFCFNGKAKFLSYNLNVNGKTYTNMFDSDWEYLELRKGYENHNDRSIPDNSREIIRIAENLSEPFQFVRVDLYNIDNHIIFSELTFFTGGGFVPFDPPEYDKKFAEYFRELE